MFDSGQLSRFCGDHRCHLNEQCDHEGRAGGAGPNCTDHTCEVPGCTRGKTAPEIHICKEHRCKRDDCPNRRVEGGSDWCYQHKCTDAACQRERPARGNSVWCNRHEPCAVAGCRGQRVVVDGVDGQDRVLEHCAER